MKKNIFDHRRSCVFEIPQMSFLVLPTSIFVPILIFPLGNTSMRSTEHVRPVSKGLSTNMTTFRGHQKCVTNIVLKGITLILTPFLILAYLVLRTLAMWQYFLLCVILYYINSVMTILRVCEYMLVGRKNQSFSFIPTYQYINISPLPIEHRKDFLVRNI